MQIANLKYLHMDVFADAPLTGNGLIVFPDAGHLDGETMQALTIEMRMFESIFLDSPDKKGRVPARIFTMEEELAFAGHPLLGAAAALHAGQADTDTLQVTFALREKDVTVTSARTDGGFATVMDQGKAYMLPRLNNARHKEFAEALNLDLENLHPELPMQVVSTGLPYLIVPLAGGLDQCLIMAHDFDEMLKRVGASFVYVLDVERMEGRTWDNCGVSEDVATGSAAGPVGAYLVQHGRATPGQPLTLRQGSFVGRPSRMEITPAKDGVLVAGKVQLVARGKFV